MPPVPAPAAWRYSSWLGARHIHDLLSFLAVRAVFGSRDQVKHQAKLFGSLQQQLKGECLYFRAWQGNRGGIGLTIGQLDVVELIEIGKDAGGGCQSWQIVC